MTYHVPAALAFAIAMVGCVKDRSAGSGSGGQVGDAAPASTTTVNAGIAEDTDPCALVSGAETESYLGPLRHPPYRVDGDGNAAADGHACRYEGQTGRRIIIEPTFTDARLAMKMMALGSQIASSVIKTDTGQADTLEGHWDEVRLMPGQHFIARRGETMVDVDVDGTHARTVGAGKLADIALGRMAKPLSYDGVAAARNAPGPLVPPRNPCTLVSRDEAVAILGPLDGDPVATSAGECTYTLAQKRLLAGQHVALTVVWRNGFASLSDAKSTMGAVMGQFDPLMAHGTSQTGVKTEHQSEQSPDDQMGKMMEQVQGVMKKQGVGVQYTKTGNLKTDSSMTGPWEEALLMGAGFSAVKKDVMVSVDLRSVPYEQGRALVTKAMQRL